MPNYCGCACAFDARQCRCPRYHRLFGAAGCENVDCRTAHCTKRWSRTCARTTRMYFSKQTPNSVEDTVCVAVIAVTTSQTSSPSCFLSLLTTFSCLCVAFAVAAQFPMAMKIIKALISLLMPPVMDPITSQIMPQVCLLLPRRCCRHIVFSPQRSDVSLQMCMIELLVGCVNNWRRQWSRCRWHCATPRGASKVSRSLLRQCTNLRG